MCTSDLRRQHGSRQALVPLLRGHTVDHHNFVSRKRGTMKKTPYWKLVGLIILMIIMVSVIIGLWSL